MENTLDQKVTESQDEQTAQTTETDDTVDYEALYKAEVKNSQKLRKRSQDTESKLTNYETKQTEIEEAKLKEEGEFKTLLDKRDSEIKDLKVKATAYDDLLTSEKTAILDKMTDEDKEQFSNLPLKELRALDKRLNETNSTNPQSGILSNSVSNKAKGLPKDWTTLPADELRDNWPEILKNAQAKSKA